MRTLPVLFVLPLALGAQAPEVRTTAKNRTGLSVTIYQNGLAAIRDTRRVTLPAGPSRLAFADLLPTLRPKSAVLLDSDAALQVLERNFAFNLLSPASLVDASLGAKVGLLGEPGSPSLEGRLVSLPLLRPRFRLDARPLDRIARKPSAYAQIADPNVLVQAQDGLRAAGPETLGFTTLPPALRASPTLLQDLVVPSPGTRELTLLYTATDLTWRPHYVLTLSTDGRSLDLDAFATVKNGSGGPLPRATLQLVAGEPHTVWDPPPGDPSQQYLVDATTVECVAAAAASPPAFREEKLSEFPLFTLDRPVDLGSAADKQLHLLSAMAIPVQSRFLVEAPYTDYGQSPSTFVEGPLFQPEPPTATFSPVPQAWRTALPENLQPAGLPPLAEAQFQHQAWVAAHHPAITRMARFENVKAHHLGRSLPEGSLVLQYRDPTGTLVLLPGLPEGTFPKTPEGESIELPLGPARGLRIDRSATTLNQTDLSPERDEDGTTHARRRWDYEVRIQCANDTASPVLLTFREPLNGDWTLLRSSHRGHRSGPDAWDFEVRIPARGYATLTYAVRTAPETWSPPDSE